MLRRLPTSVASSLAVHVALALALVGWMHWEKTHERRPVVDHANEVQLEIVAPPPPAPVVPPPPPAALARVVPPPTPAIPTRRTVTETPTRTTRTTVATSETAPSSAVPDEPAQGSIEPAPGSAAPGPVLSARDVLLNMDSLASAAAHAGAIDLGRPGSGRASRDLFGGPHYANAYEQARAAASAPTIAALAENDHMVAAGTGEHDHRVSRRAIEEFDPIRSIANLGPAVMHAPTVHLPEQHRTVNAGEAAAAEAFDQRMGASFSGMTLGVGMPSLSYHLVRADVEVMQDPTGNVTALRVVRPSHVPGFDEAAQRAIRAAMPQAPAIQSTHGRRSTWAFEVSDSQGPGLTLTNGNQGWTDLPEASSGVHLRMRVRMVQSRAFDGT